MANGLFAARCAGAINHAHAAFAQAFHDLVAVVDDRTHQIRGPLASPRTSIRRAIVSTEGSGGRWPNSWRSERVESSRHGAGGPRVADPFSGHEPSIDRGSCRSVRCLCESIGAKCIEKVGATRGSARPARLGGSAASAACAVRLRRLPWIGGGLGYRVSAGGQHADAAAICRRPVQAARSSPARRDVGPDQRWQRPPISGWRPMSGPMPRSRFPAFGSCEPSIQRPVLSARARQR